MRTLTVEDARRKFEKAANALEAATTASGVNELRARAQNGPTAFQMYGAAVTDAEAKLEPLVVARNRAFADLQAFLDKQAHEQNAVDADETASLLDQARADYLAAQESIQQANAAMDAARSAYQRTLNAAMTKAALDGDSPLRRDALGLILFGRRIAGCIEDAKEIRS